MKNREDIKKSIKDLQKEIDNCTDDIVALKLQKQMVDLLKSVCQDKDLLKEILLKNGNN